MECAGVDCGLKMLGSCEGAVGAPKHNDAASKPPASNTAIPAIFRPKLRVCPLGFICFEPVPSARRGGLVASCTRGEQSYYHARILQFKFFYRAVARSTGATADGPHRVRNCFWTLRRNREVS